MSETTPSDRSAALLLETHHQRLDEMLVEVDLMADAENWPGAKRLFERFRGELQQHMRLEEELMFPTLEATGSVPLGPTVVMRAEHASIRQFLANVEAALTEERPISRTTTELAAQLGAHNLKEERVLYPAFERTASAATRRALAAEVDTLLREPE